MIEHAKKSTEGSAPCVAEVYPDVILDSRLALFHQGERWLALSDLHYGYEISRRSDGGLWPLWGMEAIQERLRTLINDWNPQTLILVGDIVDSAAGADEAIDWLRGIESLSPEIVLIEGNHDRGTIKRHFPFQKQLQLGDFFFHHGHESPAVAGRIEVCGHFHPATRINDGAGTSLKVPSFVRETFPNGQEKWLLPAFSPWAGGHSIAPNSSTNSFRRWICSAERVFEYAP